MYRPWQFSAGTWHDAISDDKGSCASGVQHLKRVVQDLDDWLHPSSEEPAWITGRDEVGPGTVLSICGMAASSCTLTCTAFRHLARLGGCKSNGDALKADTQPVESQALLHEPQESWLEGNNTDFATGLLNSGACATLLAGLAASGIAQHHGVPHNDALAVHALQLAQVGHAVAQKSESLCIPVLAPACVATECQR